MRRATCFALLVLGTIPNVGRCQNARSKVAGEIFKTGAKLLLGAAAAESMRRAGNSSVDHVNAAEKAELNRQEYERVRRQRIDGVIQQFQSQGLRDAQTAIYSLFLNIDSNAPSIWWADLFSKPDVFFVMEVEGLGQRVLPDIRYEYDGGPVLDNIVLPALRPGTRVVVRVLDDDTNGNEIWNTILRNRVNYRFTIDGPLLPATNVLRAQVDIHGNFQVLDTPRRLVLDGPDQLATVIFQIPDAPDKAWVADGELRDSNNKIAGRVQFAQVWNTRSELESLERELERRVQDAERKEASSFGWFIFWSVLGIVCLTWFYKSFAENHRQRASKPTVLPDDGA